VVLDAHERLDADALGSLEGLVRRGGCFLLRMGLDAPVGHFPRRVLRCIEESEALRPLPGAPLLPVGDGCRGTAEQAAVVDALTAAFLAPTPSLLALVADRGRGKSSALGLALAAARNHLPSLAVAVSSASAEGSREILRFAGEVPCFSPAELVARLDRGLLAPRVIVLDEAAQLPVPLLQRITRLAPRATLAFATTCRGYEGTGRGFVLRFLDWARAEGRLLQEFTLRQPIRFDEGDPLEALVARALLLEDLSPLGPSGSVGLGGVRSALIEDESLLRQAFGLLVHAHYRTRPGDLAHLLDAPDLAVHALIEGGQVLAVSLVAREGGLTAEQCGRLARGEGRIQGHALPDTLICHGGRVEAGELTFARSVRIAVHPAFRRRGLASRLVEQVHGSHEVDAFGTIFGATPEVVRFRRALGYRLVRVGASRGARTGEPAAVMIRPVSARARALVEALEAELARNLPWQLRAFAAEGLPLDEELQDALTGGLLAPGPLAPGALEAAVEAYLESARPADTVAHALGPWVAAREGVLVDLDRRAAALLRARWIEERSWREAAEAAGFPDAGKAMKAMRPAVRALQAASSRRGAP
jgi:tRNA(Met) cytidine acetyltransferase